MRFTRALLSDGSKGARGGWVLTHFVLEFFKKFMHHVYCKQLFTCHKFKKGKLQFSLLVCKVSEKS